MPAVYIATMMEANYIIWRPQFSIPKGWPEDKRLIINFTGSLSKLPWLKSTSHGYEVDFNNLRSSAPETFDQEWLRDIRVAPAYIQSMGNEFVINIQL